MRKGVGPIVRFFAVLCLTASFASGAFAQVDDQLTANRRLLPAIGPGLRAIRLGANGRTYVLASPSPGLLVFDSQSKQLLSIEQGADTSKPAGAGKPNRASITFGEDCDVDADGNIYVADRGANSLRVFSADGVPLRSMPISFPISVAVLPDNEVAVTTLREPHLVTVFDRNGRDVREFGDPEQLTEREDLNRFLNIGRLATDGQGHLYYAFAYTPEPTVRQYDRHGYAAVDVQYTATDAAPAAQAVRREILRQEKKGSSPTFKRVLTGVGVDQASGEVWMAVGNTLLHFDKEGIRRATYQLYTTSGARLEANTILIGKDHLLIGSDPLGIYEFDRPDKKGAQ
jgi:hypothetical protein